MCDANVNNDVLGQVTTAVTGSDNVLTNLNAPQVTRAGGSRGAHRACDVKVKVCVEKLVSATLAKASQCAASTDVKCGGSSTFVAPQMLEATRPVPPSTFRLESLLKTRGVYNARKASAPVLEAMLRDVDCSPAFASFDLIGRNSAQVRRDLNRRLAKELADGTHGAAFANLCDYESCPRADDIEGMVSAYPAMESVDWDEPAVPSGLDLGLWLAWHARHCKNCTALSVASECYFRLVYHFLRSGFTPPAPVGVDFTEAKAPKRAYVDLWNDEREGCEKAFAKWKSKADNLMSEPVGSLPLRAVCVPLLPVVKEKDRWLFEKFGLAYKVRLCLDLKAGLLNALLTDWPFRYVGLQDVPIVVRKGDWLASIDISRFYLRLPAGRRLREVQWFQEPSSYAASSHDNERMNLRKLSFRQLLSVAFGLKSAPAWASIVSAELARILKTFGVKIAGVYIDDLLLCAPSKMALQHSIDVCTKVCAALGLDLNDKTTGPCAPSEGIKFLGVVIRTDSCTYHVCPHYAQYACDKLRSCLAKKAATLKELESLAGVCTWISFAMVTGKPRRNVIYRTIARLKKDGKTRTPIKGELSRQLHWWLNTLQSLRRPTAFFWNVQPDTPVICSDASGDDGWGVCAMGFHIVGPWPDGWRQTFGPDAPHMLFKELLAPVMGTLVLGPSARNNVWCVALDNSGAAYVLNKLSCRCPRTLELLRVLTANLARNDSGLLAGHAHRERNVHCDILSHPLSSTLWSQIIAEAAIVKPHRDEIHFAVLDIRRRECWVATTSFARVSVRSA